MAVIDDTTARVYEQHARELTRFATGLVGTSDAADVVADAMLRLLPSRVWADAVDHKALMYRAVLNEAKMFHRSRSRRRAREARAVSADSYEMPTIEPEVWAAVSGLTHQQRAVVFLTYWNDLDVTAVARMLGVGEGTVRKQLGRARNRLREVLR